MSSQMVTSALRSASAILLRNAGLYLTIGR